MSTSSSSGTSRPALTPGFVVVHGNRLEDLRDLLVARIKQDPLPPLCPEVFLVQSNGMKHWLELALADDAALGICAATRMELPAHFLWQVYRAVLGRHGVPAQMPFDKASLAWRLLRLLPDLANGASKAGEVAAYAPLQRYLQQDADGRKAYQLAIQVADVLDGYQNYRADWLRAWQAGHDVIDAGADEVPIGSDHTWQAQLWRDLHADVARTGTRTSTRTSAVVSRADVHHSFMLELRTHLATAERRAHKRQAWQLPERIVVFGISSLPRQTVEALALLGQYCQVLMLVQNPCQKYWGDLFSGDARRRDVANPLLASWGQQGRDYLHLLDDLGQDPAYPYPPLKIEQFVDPVENRQRASLLLQLQSAILNLEPLPTAPLRAAPDASSPGGTDESVQLVMTHSGQREVEVLHDRLLEWFERDRSLNPSDVIVMVPDITTFAPHIQAVFGRFSPGEARHVPFAVADMSQRHSPLVSAVEAIFTLPQGRVSINDWLGMFEVGAVRKRFQLSEADVEKLHDWLVQAGVRWGLDGQHRVAQGMPCGVSGLDQNTWAFGVRRMLLGYATGVSAPWQDTLPLGIVGGLDALLVARLVQWLEAVEHTLRDLAEPMSPAQWMPCITRILERFVEACDEDEERALQRLLDPLEAWLQVCEDADLREPVSLVVVREHWLAQVETPGLHQRFFGGGVQFATLMPMRSIPFKVVCLLGMNDADYPRRVLPRDFDLMQHSWRPGDRSRREDDRYLFLEALLSARERLYVSWQGRRVSDNAEQPPSVLVAQLLDYLAAGWTPTPQPVLQPLQAFSRRYFEPESGFRTFADDWRRMHAETCAAAPTNSAPTDSAPFIASPHTITCTELLQLMRQPVEVFFRHRMQVRFDASVQAEPDDEPFALDRLETFLAGQDLLGEIDPEAAQLKLRLSGTLPLGAFGERYTQQLVGHLSGLRERIEHWKARFPVLLSPLAVELNIGKTHLTGALADLRRLAVLPGAEPSAGPTPWLQLQSRPRAVYQGKDDKLQPRADVMSMLWAQHLLACACAPEGVEVTSLMLGADGEVQLRPMSADEALHVLGKLVTTYREAWLRPLPVARKTAGALLQAAGDDGLDHAELAFSGVAGRPGERDTSPYIQRAFASFDDMADELPHWAGELYGDLAAHLGTRP